MQFAYVIFWMLLGCGVGSIIAAIINHFKNKPSAKNFRPRVMEYLSYTNGIKFYFNNHPREDVDYAQLKIDFPDGERSLVMICDNNNAFRQAEFKINEMANDVGIRLQSTYIPSCKPVVPPIAPSRPRPAQRRRPIPSQDKRPRTEVHIHHNDSCDLGSTMSVGIPITSVMSCACDNDNHSRREDRVDNDYGSSSSDSYSSSND